MADRDYTIEVFKPDCLTQSLGLPLINTTYVSNSLEAVFIYNQSIIQSSNLWTANSTGGDANFCLKLSMYTNSSNGILFNFIETIYNIQVDLTTGFSTTIDVVRTQAGDGGVDTIDVDENITAYQCNDTYHEISSPPALTQGDSLQICVETEDESVFEVAKIKDTTISQNGTKSFDYVSNFVDSYWAKSSCQAVNTTASVCKVKMQLLGSYFSDADPADLSVVGKVKMDYLGRRRLLDHVVNGGTEKRDLQESGNAAVFTVSVPLSSEASVAEGMPDAEQGGASPEVSSIDVGTSSAFGISYGSVVTVSLMVAITHMMRMIG